MEDKKSPKTRECVLRAVKKYQATLKEKHPDVYQKKLNYYKSYYHNRKQMLNDALEKLKIYEVSVSE